MGDLHDRTSANREEALWARARKAGMSRREFVRFLGLGGAAAVCGNCAISAARLAWAQTTADLIARYSKNFVKDTTKHFHFPFATEAASHWWDFNTRIVPWERLFIRSRYKTPIVDKASWRLKITGEVERPMELTYDDLTKLRSLTAARTHECFGNARTLFWEQQGQKVNGGNWGFGDVGAVEWHYVPISEILDRARPKRGVVQVLFWSGVDGPDTGRPMDLSELLARPEVIGIAYGMNGKDLPPDHGGPVRLIVPGWGGAASVKWLTEIRFANHRFWTRMHTKEEALIGPDYPAEKPGPNDEFTMGVAASDVRGRGGKWQVTKSHLSIPLLLDKSPEIPPGYPLQRGEKPTLKSGSQTIYGYAYSPQGIQKVEYSTDGGATWHPATLVDPTSQELLWVRFKFNWNATPGDHVLMTRATDKKGNVQPKQVPFNELGILNSSIPRFEVRVK